MKAGGEFFCKLYNEKSSLGVIQTDKVAQKHNFVCIIL